MADTKKEYTSNLHPKGDMDTTVYPNVKSENIIDKDTTAYTDGKVPDSSLVSRSLDDLNEKIETNKIQTETNKTNIATLQGDVSSLKQDNQTTKTTIAGLVSADTTNKANIAKNTQDIETLKANYTEVQSQANTNSSNIALLETNAIKKDTDASLKSLILPSVKDLKTKDGTSFGGGGKVFEDAVIKDDKYYLPQDFTTKYESGEIVGLNFEGVHLEVSPGYTNCFYLAFTDDNQFAGGMFPLDSTSGELLMEQAKEFLIPQWEYIASNSYNSYLGFSKNNLITGLFEGKSDSQITFGAYNVTTNAVAAFNPNVFEASTIFGYVNLANDVISSINVPDDFTTTSKRINLGDINKKQSTLYRHTVKISKPTDDGNASITFTTSSEKNTPINSIQNLTTVFGNTDLSVSGATYLISSSQWEFYNKIHVGTSINDTTVDYINKDDVGTYNFIDVFGTTGFTITDNVTAM